MPSFHYIQIQLPLSIDVRHYVTTACHDKTHMHVDFWACVILKTRVENIVSSSKDIRFTISIPEVLTTFVF